MTAGLGRTLTYTSYNMPAQVVGVGYSGGASTTYNYVYNAEHERSKLVHSTLGTFIYLHPAGKGQLLYEKQTEASPSTRIEHKYYISAGGAAVAVHYVRENPNLTETTTATRYLHQDHLGSITLITNEAGGVTERLAYEAYGKRRYPAGTDDPTNGLFGQVTDRGFTSHEHLDEIALIHMNGRVYDPVLGRFVTADPFLQDPGNLQSYNRYSYVLNNPLMYVDPSGYFSLKKVFKAVAIAAIAYVTYGAVSSAMLSSAATTTAGAMGIANTGLAIATFETVTLTAAGSALAGAASGFVAGMLAGGGDLKAGFYGAVGGALTGGISGFYGSQYPVERVAANAFAGGVQSRLQGGSFAEGARSGFKFSALAYLNVQMRNEMIAQSRLDARNDGSGLSRGMFGDFFKLAGGRWDRLLEEAGAAQCSSLGCMQAGPGSIFGLRYSKGGFIDMVVEAFAGPHDKANSPWFYDSNGLIREMSTTSKLVLDLTTNYTTSLIFAAPFAAGSIYEQGHFASIRAAKSGRQ